MSNLKIYIYGGMTGLLLGLSFPPMPFFLFAFVGFVPLLFALEERKENVFLLFYLSMFVLNTFTSWWIGSWQPDTDPFLLVSGVLIILFYPFFYFIPLYSYQIIKKYHGRQTALWSLPFVWTAFEFFHSVGDMSFPWFALGYTQHDNFYWKQIADICGVYGLSFLIVLANVIVFSAIIFFRENRSKKKVQIKKGTIYLAALLAVIYLPMIYGYYRSDDFRDNAKMLAENRKLSVAVIQPNINPWRKWENSVPEMIHKHQRLQDSLISKTGATDLAVWSETAITGYSFRMNMEHEFDFLQDWINHTHIPLMTGFSSYRMLDPAEEEPVSAKSFPGDSSKSYVSYNSALMLHPDSSNFPYQIYRKMKLTPFSERIPHLQTLPFLGKWIKWGVGISSWEPGDKQHNLQLKRNSDTVNIAAIICIESIYPAFVRKFTAQGADLLTVITNDGWYDYTFGPYQHWVIAAMRAIENRRYLVRCANTGISGIILPGGEDLYVAEQYRALAFGQQVALLDETTFYVNNGDWLLWLCALIALGLLATSFAKRFSKNKNLL